MNDENLQTEEIIEAHNEELDANQKTVDALLQVDALAQASYDYYTYQQDVIENLESIKVNQLIIIENQESLITDFETSLNYSYSTMLILAIILIYTLLRNMIITK